MKDWIQKSTRSNLPHNLQPKSDVLPHRTKMPATSVRNSAALALTAEEEAYRFLLEAIIEGRYAAGQRIVAETVAEQLSMSRMPVRAALKRLHAEGLIIQRPNRGAIVRGLTVEEVQDIFDMRIALECLAMRVAAPRCTEAHLTKLQRLLEDMDAGVGDTDTWVQRHCAFHEYLCEISGRTRLYQQIHSLYTLIEGPMRLWIEQATFRRKRARAAHQILIDALRTRDPAQAEQALREHLESTVPQIIKFLESPASQR
ncbi:GntR family transcriptional regulator [Paraburkholderia flagellata]|uniref:GntR family transcriptional regulator n=1 Tax=Paraburkholderia flagellata TaxID=2883241 RepID=UPI001F1C68AA|nr:GntR family transcriptional regulator [Paraburkholderia flagellata]